MNEQEQLNAANSNFHDTIMVSVNFPITVTDHREDAPAESRFIAQVNGMQGMVVSGHTRGQALQELHTSLIVKMHHDYGLQGQLLDRITGTPPTAEEMLHMIESMLFDHYAVQGLMPTTVERAKQIILRSGGPQGWSPQDLGFDPETNS